MGCSSRVVRQGSRFFTVYARTTRRLHTLVSGNEIFNQRVRGIGVYTREDAINYGMSGANLRCTGEKYDLRKVEPYSVYERFEFDIPDGGGHGDCWSRYMCRMEEMEQSLRILEQAVEQIPKTVQH